jgi:hypothetical protein
MEISIKAMLNTCKDSPELEIGLKPYDCGSWRGAYVEAAIFVEDGFSTLNEWIPFLEKLLDEREVFEGYKGGEFSFYDYTSLHIEYGQNSATDTLWLKLFQNPTFTQQLALNMEV